MLRKILFPLILGIAGVAILLWLGFWQVERLAWKQDILTGIDARINADPVPFSTTMTEEDDEYRTVTVSGATTGQELHVLTSGTAAGTGYRVITGFETDDGDTIMLDLGLLPTQNKDAPTQPQPLDVTGTLLWPDDQNSSTPDPDTVKNIWFARNIDTMSQALDTAPFMIVASEGYDARVTPLPIAGANIKNDHLEYAITWFLLAAVWAAMTGYLILRTLRKKDA